MDTLIPDHYRILGVQPHASEADIKNAYRKLSRIYHPDAQMGSDRATDCFKQISSAYTDLGDPSRRLLYDRQLLLKDPVRLIDDPRAEKALDVLDNVVSRLRRRPLALPTSARGRDLRVQQTIPFILAMTGGPLEVKAQYDTICNDCNGMGTTDPNRMPVCHVCLGSGTFKVGLRRHDGICGFCLGRGTVVLAACPTCRARGQVSVMKTIVAQVPPRVRAGSQLRVRGAGEKLSGEKSAGAQPGDVIVVIQIQAHPLLTVDGDDLHCSVPVTWAQAVLGVKVAVPTLEGIEILSLLPEMVASRHVRIAQRGLLKGAGATGIAASAAQRGYLHLHLEVDTPEALPPEQLQAVKTLEQFIGEHRFGRVVAYQKLVSEKGVPPVELDDRW